MAAAGGIVTIRKEPSGRWRAVLKSGRSYVAGKTFDTRREAASWLAREHAALADGVDPRVGRVTVEKLLPQWLDERRASVAAKTLIADTAVPRLTPMSLLRMAINRVSDREIMRAGRPKTGRPGRILDQALPRITVDVLRLGGRRAPGGGQPGHRYACSP